MRRNILFASERDGAVFLSYLSRLRKKFGIETHAYCLMGNHFHLVVYSHDGELSRAMQWLESRYARYFNAEYSYSGSVFERRFFSDQVESDGALLQLSAYVHRNPTDVDDSSPIESYLWSSYASYVDADNAYATGWLNTDFILRLAGGANRYKELVEQLEPGSCTDAKALFARRHDHPIDLLSELDRKVVALLDIEIADIVRSHRGSSSPGRDACLVAAASIPSVTVEQIASHYGLASILSARKAVQRARKRVAKQVNLADLVTLVSQSWDAVPPPGATATTYTSTTSLLPATARRVMPLAS